MLALAWLAGGLVGWAAVALLWRVGVIAVTDTFDYTVAGAVDTRGALLTWLPNHLDTFAIGAAFGASSQRTGFCTMGAVADIVPGMGHDLPPGVVQALLAALLPHLKMN